MQLSLLMNDHSTDVKITENKVKHSSHKEKNDNSQRTSEKTGFDRFSKDLVVYILTFLSPIEIVGVMRTCRIIRSAAKSKVVSRMYTVAPDARYVSVSMSDLEAKYENSALVRAAVIEALNKDEPVITRYRQLQREAPQNCHDIAKWSAIFLVVPIVVGLSVNSRVAHYSSLAGAILIVFVCLCLCYRNSIDTGYARDNEQTLSEQHERLLSMSGLRPPVSYGSIDYRSENVFYDTNHYHGL